MDPERFNRADAAGESELAVTLGLDAATTSRCMGRVDRVDAIYALVERHAKQLPTDTGYLRTQINAAATLRYRGRTRVAVQQIESITPHAEANGSGALVTLLYNIRGNIELQRGNAAEAIRWTTRALEHAPNAQSKEFARVDRAASLFAARQYDVARDQFLTLRRESSSADIVQTATLNLLELAAQQADRRAFDEHRHSIDPERLMPSHRAFYYYAVGLGLRKFGNHQQSRQSMQTALAIARAYQCREEHRRIENVLRQWGVIPNRHSAPATFE